MTNTPVTVLAGNVKGAEMNSTSKPENGILCSVAFACYVFALVNCGAAAYALAVLSLKAYGNLEQGLSLTASYF
jgi:hypothetical protein